MIRIFGKNLALAALKVTVLTGVIYGVLRFRGGGYELRLSITEFLTAVLSGRLLGDPGLAGLPPLEPAVLSSGATVLLALVLSYGMGAPLGMVLGRYRMPWTQVLGHGVVSVAFAVPAFWVGYVVLYYSISEWGVFIGGAPSLLEERQWREWVANCLLLAVPLSLSGIAFVARQVAHTLLTAFPEGSIRSARSLGITQRMMFDIVGAAVIWRPLLRSLPYLMSLFLSVLMVVETAFFVPGFGYAVYKAARESDLPNLAVLSLWVTLVLVAVNLVVEIIVELIDRNRPVTPGAE